MLSQNFFQSVSNSVAKVFEVEKEKGRTEIIKKYFE